MRFPPPPAAGPDRLPRLAALAGACALALALSVAGTATAKPKVGDGKGGVKLRELGSFSAPMHIGAAPGSKSLLFVVERRGTIGVIRGKQGLDRPFLDISDRVQGGGEEGLLSMAFPPDYAQSGRFYVYYTVRGGDINRVSEFRRNSATTADPASERVVLEIGHPTYGNHNGGQLQFGPDGLLYIGTGDGGGGGDPDENAQDPDSLLGKLLRISPTPGNGGAYGVPNSNPFAGATPGRGEIYSLGLRNPWRFSFDRKTGRLTIADVGQGRWEEVNHETLATARGANFGWDIFEGNHQFEDGGAPPSYRPPIHEYSHDGGGCAIIGGFVVRDPKLKSLYGRYLYGDYCTGELRSLIAKPGGAKRDRALGQTVDSLGTIGEGSGGKIYMASVSGQVWKLVRK